MAVFHTPIVSISSTALTTLLAPTKPKSSNLASLPISGCVIPRSLSKIPSLFLLRATPLQKYVYPDPIPEFAVYETKKFREELKKKLYKERDTFGDDLDKVVDTCTEPSQQNLQSMFSWQLV
ncbi:protein PLASTID REDOX INSENSITIVE 2, chloroplastic isoform X2 [Lactuca sativa]|uniref:protein PLASTID REDOX INSENSITIVE 2, chloroplastic isoform X2 n=1 Tax=Lactuca sativa TaxID=4236 RepID=UPI000CD82C3C|nr:protein PLASTID REDOX INSENSITIVE 2, chloroplastic isoform X2 [Lactuca sativa]